MEITSEPIYILQAFYKDDRTNIYASESKEAIVKVEKKWIKSKKNNDSWSRDRDGEIITMIDSVARVKEIQQ